MRKISIITHLCASSFIRNHARWDDLDMVLADTRSFDNLLDARKFEHETLGTLGATLNRDLPTRRNKRRMEEYHDANRETYKEYRDQHKGEQKERMQQYREEHEYRFQTYSNAKCI